MGCNCGSEEQTWLETYRSKYQANYGFHWAEIDPKDQSYFLEWVFSIFQESCVSCS